MHSRRIAAIAAAFGACLLAAGGAGAMTIITLQADGGVSVRIGEEAAVLIPPGTAEALRTGLTPSADPAAVEELLAEGTCAASRSEEHTSELQSLMRISYAVFCLQKKNTTNT